MSLIFQMTAREEAPSGARADSDLSRSRLGWSGHESRTVIESDGKENRVKTIVGQVPALASLVEHQMRNWEIAKSQKVAAPTGRQEVEEFICLSREVGVDADAIGALLGKQLNWPVFDKEVLHAMAGNDAVRERIYASMDERDLGWCEDMLRSLMQPEFVRNDYFHRLSRAILALARQGSAVFIGRGADRILPRDHGFRVRLVAPLETRVEAVARATGKSDAKARSELQRLERERDEFLRRHFGADPRDAHRYDLVINLARFSVNQAAEVILSARKLSTVRRDR